MAGASARFTALAMAAMICAPGGAAAGAETPDSTRAFEASVSLVGYVFDGEGDYLVPMAYFDRGMLHLEARWQYENLDTGSLWAGATWSGGEEFTWEATPMAGVIFGETDGFAPGLEATLGWRSLEFYAEAEYLVDFADSESNFFYAWNEWSYYPADAWRVGIVGQRTRAYRSDLEVDRGLLAGVAAGRFTFTVYGFNLDRDESFVALQAGASF